MEYNEFLAHNSNLFAAGELIASLQRGDAPKEWMIHSMFNKKYELSNNRYGDILCLAIEMRRYLAAIQLLEYNTTSDDKTIKDSLVTSLEGFNGEEELEQIREAAKQYSHYEKLLVEKEANLTALEMLKGRYLNKEYAK